MEEQLLLPMELRLTMVAVSKSLVDNHQTVLHKTSLIPQASPAGKYSMLDIKLRTYMASQAITLQR